MARGARFNDQTRKANDEERREMRRNEMRKRAIPIIVMVASFIATPPAYPDQERAANPSKIELLPEQLDAVTAGVALACGPTSPTTFECVPQTPGMGNCAPGTNTSLVPFGSPLGITDVCELM
jgi:hypothetical protein